MNLTGAAGCQDMRFDLTTACVLAASALLLMQKAAYSIVGRSPLASDHDKFKCHEMLGKLFRHTFLRLALIMMVLGLSCFPVLFASAAAATCRLSMSKARDPPDLASPGLQRESYNGREDRC